MENSQFRLLAVSESAVLAYPKQGDVVKRNEICQNIARYMLNMQTRPDWLLDAVPSYDSIMLHYDCLKADHHEVFDEILNITNEPESTKTTGKLILPVCYTLDADNDLVEIAQHTGLAKSEVVRRHCESDYTVYAIGFAPGFAYMGFVPEELQTPRRASPRTSVPKGAVAIADRQTAIYPTASPGGWNIVGYCPLNLVDFHCDPISPFRVGQTVGFTQIDSKEFDRYKDKHWNQWLSADE